MSVGFCVILKWQPGFCQNAGSGHFSCVTPALKNILLGWRERQTRVIVVVYLGVVSVLQGDYWCTLFPPTNGLVCSWSLISQVKTTLEYDQPHAHARRLGIRDPATPISVSCCSSAHLSHHLPLTQFCLNRWGHGLNTNSPHCQFTRHSGRSPTAAFGHLCSVCVCAYQGACHRCTCVTAMADLPQPWSYVSMEVHVNQNASCFFEP